MHFLLWSLLLCVCVCVRVREKREHAADAARHGHAESPDCRCTLPQVTHVTHAVEVPVTLASGPLSQGTSLHPSKLGDRVKKLPSDKRQESTSEINTPECKTLQAFLPG